jgi:hypothetical protein
MVRFLLSLNTVLNPVHNNTERLGKCFSTPILRLLTKFRPVDVTLPAVWEKGSKELMEDVVKYGV